MSYTASDQPQRSGAVLAPRGETRGCVVGPAGRAPARRIPPPAERGHPPTPAGHDAAAQPARDDLGALGPLGSGTTTVAVADRQRWIAEALRAMLVDEGFVVYPVTTTTQQLEPLVAQWSPDVVLVDLGLPEYGALEAGRRIVRLSPATHVAVLSAVDDETADREARSAGLAGCLSKQISPTQLVRIVRRLVDHGRVQLRVPVNGRARSAVPHLTRRELEIMRLLSEGASGKRIAAALDISQHTVRTHVQNVLAKLNVSSRIEAVACALSWGILPAPDAMTAAHDQAQPDHRSRRDSA
jgi:DNA-binding NarL/FixJ family response regulator